MSRNLKLLLDTHAWIWLNNGSHELKSNIISIIDKAANQGELYVSAISIWEVATLVAKKRIILRTSIQDWIEEALSQPGLELVPLLPNISIESTQLPDGINADPADRIIIATARLHHLTVLTRDANLLSYSQSGYVNSKEI